jgi:hypothetical protein
MANSLECIYENVPTLSPSKLFSQSQNHPNERGHDPRTAQVVAGGRFVQALQASVFGELLAYESEWEASLRRLRWAIRNNLWAVLNYVCRTTVTVMGFRGIAQR